MYTLILESEERDALITLLECALSDLHTEIVHTDNRCYKEALIDQRPKRNLAGFTI
jgi:hypothetical protein